VTLLVYLLYRLRRRPGEKEEVVSPSRPAHVIALEQLGTLKGKKLWQHGHIKQYYSEVTEILRRYFENRFRVMALEETTEEILTGLREISLRPEIIRKAETILTRADLVKFAKSLPAVSEHEETLAAAYAIVETTMPSAVEAIPETGMKAAADVGS
jgi:hypothetical protein